MFKYLRCNIPTYTVKLSMIINHFNTLHYQHNNLKYYLYYDIYNILNI